MDKKSKGLQIVFKNKVSEIHFLRYTIKKKNCLGGKSLFFTIKNVKYHKQISQKTNKKEAFFAITVNN
jgi:hypothetical protein